MNLYVTRAKKPIMLKPPAILVVFRLPDNYLAENQLTVYLSIVARGGASMCIHWNPLRELTSPRQRNDVRSRYESPYLFRERIVRYSCPSLSQRKGLSLSLHCRGPASSVCLPRSLCQ